MPVLTGIQEVSQHTRQDKISPIGQTGKLRPRPSHTSNNSWLPNHCSIPQGEPQASVYPNKLAPSNQEGLGVWHSPPTAAEAHRKPGTQQVLRT